jgi:mRNA interferase MazF
MSARPPASRGDVWMADLDPTQGHAQAGQRPCAIISNDHFNHGPADLLIVVPLTSRRRAITIPLHVFIAPPEGGLTMSSTVLCDQIRTIDPARLLRRMGTLSEATMAEIGARLRQLLVLP